MIYFIQSGDSQFVKIGFCAGEPKMRLAQLQCGNPEPLKLLAVRTGDREAESHWHDKFSHLRVRGEWFTWCDEIKEYALPLLAEPNDAREARVAYARDLIAGRPSSREVLKRLFGGRRWSDDRRAAHVAKAKRTPCLYGGE